jgi:hypothetical protein
MQNSSILNIHVSNEIVINLCDAYKSLLQYIFYRSRFTTKSSQAKNVPNIQKMSDQWLSPIKLYYSKKMWNSVFNYNKHHQKAYKKPHIRHSNSFLILQASNSFWVIAILNVKIGPKCRNKDWVLGQKRVFDSVQPKNNLRYKKTVWMSYMQIFVSFLMMQVIFVVIEYKISHFFAVNTI